MEPSLMSTILSDVTTLVTNAISWMSSYLTAITGNDVLLLFVVVLPLVGLGIGIITRLFRLRA